MPLEIRQGRVEDWAALERFNAATYAEQARYKGFERFRWQFVDNPATPYRDGRIPAWVALEDGEVVGIMCAQPGALTLGGETRAAAWLVDFMVRESQRGRGLGKRIHEAIAAEMPLLVTLTMSPATRVIAERLGCVTLAPTHQFTRLARLDSASASRILAERTRYRPGLNKAARTACGLGAGAVIAGTVNAGLALSRAAGKGATKKTDAAGLRIEEVAAFGVETDTFWGRAQAGYPAIFTRDARALNWRFRDSPDLDYRRFIAWRGNEMAGYLVLRRQDPVELPYGVIADLLTAREDEAARGALIDFAVAHFGHSVAAVEAAASIPELSAALRQRGFFVSRTVHPTVIAHDKALLADMTANPDGWYFTKGDQDWDQIHPALRAD